MAKGYYWIEPWDDTLNDFQFYRTIILDTPVYDKAKGRISIRTREHFPVGSVFRVMRDCEEFVIEEKLKKWGNHYIIKKKEGELDWESVNKIRKDSLIFRVGYMHGGR